MLKLFIAGIGVFSSSSDDLTMQPPLFYILRPLHCGLTGSYQSLQKERL